MASIEKTSASHPIYVDFLPADAAAGPGRIGLTIAPGKQASGIDGEWRRDVDMDLARLRSEYDAGVLVSLCEPHELAFLKIADLHARARAHGIAVEPFPYADGGVPGALSDLASLLERMAGAVREGRTVVIHCRGGLGRSGTVAACALIARGASAEDAIRVVRASRKGAVENERQEEFVRQFADWHSRRQPL
ncbi:MAG: cyclin-dependent kinase inhibitor 3 family protein [Polyangiaceae bacterium]